MGQPLDVGDAALRREVRVLAVAQRPDQRPQLGERARGRLLDHLERLDGGGRVATRPCARPGRGWRSPRRDGRRCRAARAPVARARGAGSDRPRAAVRWLGSAPRRRAPREAPGTGGPTARSPKSPLITSRERVRGAGRSPSRSPPRRRCPTGTARREAAGRRPRCRAPAARRCPASAIASPSRIEPNASRGHEHGARAPPRQARSPERRPRPARRTGHTRSSRRVTSSSPATTTTATSTQSRRSGARRVRGPGLGEERRRALMTLTVIRRGGPRHRPKVRTNCDLPTDGRGRDLRRRSIAWNPSGSRSRRSGRRCCSSSPTSTSSASTDPTSVPTSRPAKSAGSPSTRRFSLGTTAYIVIPSLMVFGALVLRPRLNRILNIGLSIMYAVTIVAGAIGEWTLLHPRQRDRGGAARGHRLVRVDLALRSGRRRGQRLTAAPWRCA